MRTKTLLLSGVVAALSGASIMAQVYSANAVGYVNVTVPGGVGGKFAMVADQLFANGAGQAQYISTASSTGVLDSLLDNAHNGVIVSKLTNGTYVSFAVTANSVLGQPPSWQPSAAGATLNPGEAVWVYNPFTTNITITFVGTVPQGTALTNTALIGSAEWTSGSGISMISSVIPQTGAVDSVLGLTNGVASPGDIINVFDPDTQNFVTSAATLNGSSFTWQPTPATPAVGQGFFYYAVNPAGVNWVRNFSVN
jgi:hypothetical protein